MDSSKGLIHGNNHKLNEKEFNWLIHSIMPRSCDDCIWIDDPDERYYCLYNKWDEAPCRLFLDKILNYLEKNDVA